MHLHPQLIIFILLSVTVTVHSKVRPCDAEGKDLHILSEARTLSRLGNRPGQPIRGVASGSIGQLHGTGGSSNGGSGIIHGGSGFSNNQFLDQSKSNLLTQRFSNLAHKHGIGIKGGANGNINQSQLNGGTVSALAGSPAILNQGTFGSGLASSQVTGSGVFGHKHKPHSVPGSGIGGNLHHSHHLHHHGIIGSQFFGGGGTLGHHHLSHEGFNSLNAGSGVVSGLGQIGGHLGGLGLFQGSAVGGGAGGTMGHFGLGNNRPHLGLINSNTNQPSVSNNLMNVGPQSTLRPTQGQGLLSFIYNRPGLGGGILNGNGQSSGGIFGQGLGLIHNNNGVNPEDGGAVNQYGVGTNSGQTGHQGGLGLIHNIHGIGPGVGGVHQYGSGTSSGQEGHQVVHIGSPGGSNYQGGGGVGAGHVTNHLHQGGITSQGQSSAFNGGGGVFYGHQRPQGVVYQVHWSQPGGYGGTGAVNSGNSYYQTHQGTATGVGGNQNLNGNQGGQIQITNGYNQLGQTSQTQGFFINGGANQQGTLTSHLVNSFQTQGHQLSSGANTQHTGNTGSTGIFSGSSANSHGISGQGYGSFGGQNVGTSNGISTSSNSNTVAATHAQGSNGQVVSIGSGSASGISTGSSQSQGSSGQSQSTHSGSYYGTNLGQVSGVGSGSSGSVNSYGSGTTAQVVGGGGQYFATSGGYGGNNLNGVQSSSSNLGQGSSFGSASGSTGGGVSHSTQSGLHSSGVQNGQFTTMGNGHYSGSSGNSVGSHGSGTTQTQEGGQYFVVNGVHGQTGNSNSLSQASSSNMQSLGNSGSQYSSAGSSIGTQQSQGSGQQYGGYQTGTNAGLAGSQFQNSGTTPIQGGAGDGQTSSIVGGYFTGSNADSSFATSSASQTQGSSNHLSSVTNQNIISSNAGASGNTLYGLSSQNKSEVSNTAASSVSTAGGGSHSSTNNYGGTFLVASHGHSTNTQPAWPQRKPVNQPGVFFEGNLGVIDSQDNKKQNSGIQNSMFADEYVESDSDGQSAETGSGTGVSGGSGSFIASGNLSGNKVSHAGGSFSSSSSIAGNQQEQNSAGIDSGIYHIGATGELGGSGQYASSSGDTSQLQNSQSQGVQAGHTSTNSQYQGTASSNLGDNGGGSGISGQYTSPGGSTSHLQSSQSHGTQVGQTSPSSEYQGTASSNFGTTGGSGISGQYTGAQAGHTSPNSQYQGTESSNTGNKGNSGVSGQYASSDGSSGYQETTSNFGNGGGSGINGQLSSSGESSGYQGTSVGSIQSPNHNNGLTLTTSSMSHKPQSSSFSQGSSVSSSSNSGGTNHYEGSLNGTGGENHSSSLGINGNSNSENGAAIETEFSASNLAGASSSSAEDISSSSEIGTNGVDNLDSQSSVSQSIDTTNSNHQVAGSTTDSTSTGSNIQPSQSTSSTSSTQVLLGSNLDQNKENSGNYNLNVNNGTYGGSSVSNNQAYKPSSQHSTALLGSSNTQLGTQENYSSMHQGNLGSSNTNEIHIANNGGESSQLLGPQSGNSQYAGADTSGSGVYGNSGNIGLNNNYPNSVHSSGTSNGQAIGSHGTLSSSQQSGSAQFVSGSSLSQNNQEAQNLEGTVGISNQGQSSGMNNLEQSYTLKPTQGGSSNVEGTYVHNGQQSGGNLQVVKQPVASSGMLSSHGQDQLSSSSSTNIDSHTMKHQEGYGSAGFMAGSGSNTHNEASLSGNSGSTIHTQAQLQAGAGASLYKQSQGSLQFSQYVNPQYTQRYVIVPGMVPFNMGPSTLSVDKNGQQTKYTVVHTEDGSYFINPLETGQAMEHQGSGAFQTYYIDPTTGASFAGYVDNHPVSLSGDIQQVDLTGDISGHLGKQGNFQGLLSIPSRIVGVISGVGNSLKGFVSQGISGGFQGNAEHNGEVGFEGSVSNFPAIHGSIHGNFENHISGSGSVEGSAERMLPKRKVLAEARSAVHSVKRD